MLVYDRKLPADWNQRRRESDERKREQVVRGGRRSARVEAS
jgi:hypothetical protein